MVLTMLLAMFTAVGLQDGDKSTTVRAFVYTATTAGGERTAEEQGRLDAVRDMQDALGRKKGITLVSNRDEANLLVEVLGREQRDAPDGGFGGKTITRMGDTIIRLHLQSGGEESDLKGIGQGTWGRAAKDAADRLVKWIARREPRRSSVAVIGPIVNGRTA
jgi:hypothetical protein